MSNITAFVDSPMQFFHTGENDISKRIESLAAHYKISYYQIAKEMGISRGTVHALRNGRKATHKMVGKLETAEKRLASTDVTPKNCTARSLLLFAVNSNIPEETPTKANEILVRKKGTDANPHPNPIHIKLTAPPLIKGINAIVQAQAQDKCNDLLKACLPQEYANDQWIEQLNPTSFLATIKKAVVLIMGPDWKSELPKLIEETEAQNKLPNPETLASIFKPDQIKDIFEMVPMPPRISH